MAQKVYITRGLPGSGKSTWAKQVAENRPIINNDNIRKDLLCNPLFSQYKNNWKPAFEKEVQKNFFIDLKLFMDQGFSVILDNTYLNPKTFQKIQTHLKQNWPSAEIIIKDFRDVSLEVCLERDEKRKKLGERFVGHDAIMEMWSNFIKPTIKPPEFIQYGRRAIICDLDGTLAILNGRSPYDASNCDKTDTINTAVYNLIDLFSTNGVKILFTSGRKEKDREPTVKFLTYYGFNPSDNKSELFMRRDDSSIHDYIEKQYLYETYIKGKYNVLFAIDDRPQIVRLWKTLGIPTFNVGDGYEF